MKQKLEQITKETCVYKIMALRNAYVSEEYEHCRCNCSKNYREQCAKYKPISKTQIPFRQGRFSYVQM